MDNLRDRGGDAGGLWGDFQPYGIWRDILFGRVNGHQTKAYYIGGIIQYDIDERDGLV